VKKVVRMPVLGGSLKLPPAHELGVAVSAMEQLNNKWNTIARVDAKLAKFGITEPEEPEVKWQPVTTALLLTNNLTEYTTMYSAQLRWFNYANRLLANVKAELLGVANELKDLAVEARSNIRRNTIDGKKKLTAQEIKDLVENDPNTLELRLREQELEQMNIKLSAWVEELDESRKVVSRQIELRRIELEAGRREPNTGGGPAPTGGAWQPRTPRSYGGG
jgi:hypothetical protein